MAGELDGLQAKVRAKHESAIFVHCCAHVLNLVLSQLACCARKECKIFFSTINGLCTFFTKSSKRTNALDNIVKKRFPKAAPTRWNYSSRLVNTVKENLDDLKQLFENIIENPDAWDGPTINSAIGFCHHLKETKFLFLVELFSEIFFFTDVLFNIFQIKSIDILYCKEQLDKTRAVLEKKLDEFAAFYEMFEEKYGIGTRGLTRRGNNKSVHPQQHYKMLYNEILVEIIEQLKVRYASLKELKFIELLNFKKTEEYRKKFPVHALNSLKTVYGNYFDMPRLQSKLRVCVVYSMEDYMNKSVSELMEFINVNNLSDAMPELFRLCVLILTIPSTTASVERSFSALKRIKIYQRNTTGENRISELSLMSIEADLLKHLMQTEEFYEKVINLFAEKNRKIELIYK